MVYVPRQMVDKLTAVLVVELVNITAMVAQVDQE
jgi:hypothetical protein